MHQFPQLTTMTTHAGSWPIDTSLSLLSPLSTQHADLGRATKPFVPSSQTSSNGSETLRSALSRSCSTSSSTSIGLIGEKHLNHSKAHPREVSAVECLISSSKQPKTSKKAIATGDTVGRTFTDSSPSDMAEFRTSQRVRKPTSKAQALVGTNYFRSYKQNGHSADRSETPEHRQDGESPREIQSQMSALETQHSQKPLTAEESAISTSEPPSIPLLLSSDNGENMSTSDTSPPRRLSTRERKPAAKLVESSEIHETRKRKFPEEGLEFKGMKKIKLSISPSKLREYVSANHDEKTKQVLAESPPARESQPDLTTGSQTSSETKPLENPATRHVVLKLPSRLLAQVGQSIKVEVAQTEDEASAQNELKSGSERSRSETQCDLSCLSPSSVLLAFSQVAVDWPDSEDEIGPEMSQEDQNSRLKKSLSQYCRCDQSSISSIAHFKKSDDVPEKTSSSAIPDQKVAAVERAQGT